MTCCSVCKFEINVHEQPGYRSEFCSDFCAQSSPEEKAKLPTLEAGDWGCFPCTDCGEILEGDFSETACCSGCSKLRKAADRAFALIKENIEAELKVWENTAVHPDVPLRRVLTNLPELRKLLSFKRS